jgi:hypothetical protein
MQDVLFAGDLLGDRNRGGASRVDEDDLGGCDTLAGEALLALVDGLPLQVRQPVGKEVVRLRFI